MPDSRLRDRIRAEYLEMPGMRLKLAQVQRLCGVERLLCQAVLARLVDEGFLCVKPDGHYARLTDGPNVPRPQPAKAEIETDSRARQAS
jgi:hypothetical protein